MNCEPGDIAVIVISEFGNEGRLVEVLGQSHWGVGYWYCKSLGSPCMTDFGVATMEGSVEDRRLRPIRPGKTYEAVDVRLPCEALTT